MTGGIVWIVEITRGPEKGSERRYLTSRGAHRAADRADTRYGACCSTVRMLDPWIDSPLDRDVAASNEPGGNW